MNTEALFLFLILLLGLVLCSFLGGNCGKEGLTNNSTKYNGPNGATATMSTNSSGTPNNGPSQTFTPSSSFSTTSSSTPSSTSLSSYFDNYNHYTGSGSSSELQNGMVFTDTSGNTVTVITNSNGSQSLQLNSVGQSTPMILSSTPSSNSNIQAQPNTFYAPYGGVTATITTDSNDQTAIQVNVGNNTVLFVQSGSVSNSQSTTTSSTQYFGSTGTSNQPAPYSLSYTGQDSSATQYYGPYGGSAGSVTGPYGNTAYYAQGPYGNTVAGTTTSNNPNYSSNQYYGPNGGSAGSVTGPYGNTAYYAQGPYGNTVAGTTTSNNYYDSLPSGIPASQIPPGQEDLYILKSEVVPPVCPACPQSSACPRQEPCPPCPACARCPEPAFECKKVPNYDVIDSDYLPTPILNDFSSFGM